MQDVQRISEFFSQLLACFPEKIEKWNSVLSKSCKVNLDDTILFSKILNIFSTVASEIESYSMISFTVRVLEKKGPNGIQNSDLCSSILLSMVQFLEKITQHDTGLLDSLFLTGLMLIPVSDIQCYNAIMHLLNQLIRIMTQINLFDGYEHIGEYFINSYKTEDLLKQFEQHIGVTFEKNFSFALSTLIMKGIIEPKTRDQTLKFLRQLLKTSNKIGSHSKHSLGFITPLLSFEQRYQKQVYLEQFYKKEIFDTPERIFLFQKYLFTLAKELTVLEEIISVYTPLTEGFNLIPLVFTDVFKDHASLTQVVKVYTAPTSSEALIDCGLSLFKSMTQGHYQLSTKEPFTEYGFSGFKKHINFQNPLKDQCTIVSIKYMKKNFDNQQGLEILEEEKKQLEKQKQEEIRRIEEKKKSQQDEKKAQQEEKKEEKIEEEKKEEEKKQQVVE